MLLTATTCYNILEGARKEVDPRETTAPTMKETLARRAYVQLRLKLSRGELPPGARLVNRVLADELGISFTPVREAINQLASEGLVEYVRGGGAFVRQFDRRSLVELYDLREQLEPFATAKAAHHITEDEIEELQEIADDWHELCRAIRGRDPQVADEEVALRWVANEERFHHVLIDASRNRWLTKIAKDLLLATQAFGPLLADPSLLTLGAAARTWKGHAVLVRLLRQRDADRARDWMVDHIRIGRRYVLERLKGARATERAQASERNESNRLERS